MRHSSRETLPIDGSGRSRAAARVLHGSSPVTTTTFGRAVYFAAAILLLGANLPAQEESPPEEPDPEIEATIGKLEDAWPEPGEPFGAQTRHVVERLREFASEPLHPTDRERLLLTFRQILLRGEVRPPSPGTVYRRAMNGLAALGPPGGERLIALHEDGRFPTLPEYAPLRASLVRAIGRSGADRAPEYLVEIVRSSGEDEILLAAGDVMRHFADSDREVRQPLVEVLARRLAGFENLAHRRPADPDRHRDLVAEDARQTLRSLDGIWRHTLHALTGVSHGDGQGWWEWYQENKDEPWPEDAERGGRETRKT